MYITFASAESDFNAGAVLGEVPSMSLLKQEAKESIESTYSFASAESDFSTMSWPEVDQMNEYKIGKGLSFACAESDYVSGFSMPEITKSELELEMESSISQNYSFSSAESDFVSAEIPEIEQLQLQAGFMSFSSPESDFCMGETAPIVSNSVTELKQEAYESINKSYGFASAESDFVATETPSMYRNEVLVPPSLSFASPESDWVGSVAAAYGALDMGLGVSRKHSSVYVDNEERVKVSLDEAISSNSVEPRVITEGVAPFRVVHANEAWKDVYGKNEGILGHTLAMANVMALGKHEAQSYPTKLGMAQLKVQPIEGNLMLNILEGHKQEAKTKTPEQKTK